MDAMDASRQSAPERQKALFEQIRTEHAAALGRLTRGYERNEAMRAELEQEVWLNLWRALPGYRAEASLRTWMYRVAHNTAIRHVSKAGREPKKSDDESGLEQAPSSAPTAESRVVQADARAALRQAVRELRPVDRQVMLLYFEEVGQAEIADITGLSQANVSTRIHRIKGALQKRLSR